MTTSDVLLKRPALPGLCRVTAAVQALSTGSGAEERGAIFTRREVVDFMLDLVGYSDTEALYSKTLLEPSFGGGEFLLAAVERLLRAYSGLSAAERSSVTLDACIRGVELHQASFAATREKLLYMVCGAGFVEDEAERLVEHWLMLGDFLLTDQTPEVDFVVGNPPYVRQERIAGVLLQEYRARYLTMYDRADLYVPFIERSLHLLKPGGALCFICADRWMKNRYGGPLRALVARDFHLKAYVDMVDSPAFHSDVIAYPAITVIERARGTTTLVAQRPGLDRAELRALAGALNGDASGLPPHVHVLDDVVNRSEPWVLQTSTERGLLRRVEGSYPPLEDAGCKVGIGVATGADNVFVGLLDELDVEPSRKLPLAMTRDIKSGEVVWTGKGVLNPFHEDGSLVELAVYPRFARYLEKHRHIIAARHVARRDEVRWYRTIDRITPALAARPKLLIPDIKGEANVVLEEGRLYPHHNLYYVLSDEWDLRALQAVLLSSLTRLFIATYSTKMRGGFLRFQAQYLRRIRLPRWALVSDPLRTNLVRAAALKDLAACDEAVCELYALTAGERQALLSFRQSKGDDALT